MSNSGVPSKTIYSRGLHEIQIAVCCKKMADAEDINFQDKEWTIFCEGQYLYRYIIFCPFCGSKLPNPPVEVPKP